MTDNLENSPKPTEPEPLAYWNPKDHPPTPTPILGLMFIGGLLTSLVGVFVIGGTCLFAPMNSIHSPSPLFALIAGGISLLWFAWMIFCIIWATRKVRQGRTLSLEWRRQPRRFFIIGLLIGCGVAALIEGICFGAAAMSS